MATGREAVLLLLLGLLVTLLEPAYGIECYRCISTNSTSPFLCNEFLPEDQEMDPSSCDDVYDAKYCIKQVGRSEALSIDCYQCTSADEWMCENSELVVSYLKPTNCNYVFEAQYCVKTHGRYGDGIGTKRYCSSVNRGNYCEYVSQPGDKLIYRTCVYTCNSDGCNPASTATPSKLLYALLSLPLFRFLFLR